MASDKKNHFLFFSKFVWKIKTTLKRIQFGWQLLTLLQSQIKSLNAKWIQDEAGNSQLVVTVDTFAQSTCILLNGNLFIEGNNILLNSRDFKHYFIKEKDYEYGTNFQSPEHYHYASGLSVLYNELQHIDDAQMHNLEEMNLTEDNEEEQFYVGLNIRITPNKKFFKTVEVDPKSHEFRMKASELYMPLLDYMRTDLAQHMYKQSTASDVKFWYKSTEYKGDAAWSYKIGNEPTVTELGFAWLLDVRTNIELDDHKDDVRETLLAYLRENYKQYIEDHPEFQQSISCITFEIDKHYVAFTPQISRSNVVFTKF
jgi:hypothetical protein